MRVCYEQARVAHPEVEVSFDDFRARVLPLADAGGAVAPDRAADLYLACACEDGNAAGLARFEALFRTTIRTAVAKVIAGADAIDDVTQELRQRLFCGPSPSVRSFAGRGPLWKWLRISAIRLAHEWRAAHGLPVPASPDVIDGLLQEEATPENRLARQRYGEMVRAAIAQAFEALVPDEKALLRLQYIERQGIDRLAALFHINRATAARRLAEIRRKVGEDVRARIGVQLPQLTDDEARSLWRAVQSQIHLSLSRIV